MKQDQQKVYMTCAEAFAKLSKARRASVGAVLVTKQGLVIPGVNGTPSGTDNNCEIEHRSHEGDSLLVTKQEVLHAELNCLLKAAREGVSILDSEIFVTLSPCLPCSAMLKQAGVKRVYYREQYRDESGIKYLQDNGVEVERI